MSNDKTHNRHTEQPSALEVFPLSFEYDMSWADARKAVKKRTA